MADLLGPKEVLEIQRQGHAAAAAGEPVTACPWRDATKDGTEEVDRARRAMWVRGYAAGRTDLRAASAGGAGAGELPAPPAGLLLPPVET